VNKLRAGILNEVLEGHSWGFWLFFALFQFFFWFSAFFYYKTQAERNKGYSDY
jgi:hypothetical protein